jgi:hypothetical protein
LHSHPARAPCGTLDVAHHQVLLVGAGKGVQPCGAFPGQDLGRSQPFEVGGRQSAALVGVAEALIGFGPAMLLER